MTQIKSNIPKIRFKEFSGEWDEKKLGDIFQINAGGDIDINHVSKEKTNIFKYPIFANAKKNKGFYGYSDIYKNEESVLTVAGRGIYLGIAHARNEKFYPIVRLLTLKPKNKSDIIFFEYQINNINFFIESTGVPQLTGPQISIYKTCFPQLPEQQKIASFLSLVDEKIENIKEKKKSLEEYKKGVMQKIFKQEIRFKDENGEEFREWEVKKLGEVCKKQSSNISANTLENNTGNYKIYGAAGILKNIDFYKEEKPYLAIVKDGAGVGRILYCEGESSVLGTLDIIKPNKYTNLYFLYLIFQQINFKSYTVGSTIPHIYFKDYSNKKILFPSLLEQQKIADFLSGIDEDIESIGGELEKMEEFKNGLLQGMFV